MHNNKLDPVLIVGAGPSGLMAALLLSRLEIPVRIIDKALTKSPYSRAIGVQIRTLEIFSSLGILPELMKQGISVTNFQINTEHAFPIDLDPKFSLSLFHRPAIVDQPHTEAVLESALLEHDVSVERGVEFLNFVDENDGTQAHVKEVQGHISKQKYSAIIGADGAHSTVRKKMNNSFLGRAYDDAFILADVELDTDAEHKLIRLYFKGRKFLALIPMVGHNHYRLISVRPNERAKMGPDPDVLEFQKLIDKIVPFRATIRHAEWVSRFFVQCRSAAHYQQGKIFLVGDAAHIHSPAGGQGMNTGLQDALNLCYKLSMVLTGRAHSSLLLSYHEERKPVGEFLLKYTDRLFQFMVRGSFFARLFRTFVLPRLMRTRERQARFFRIGSQVAIRYRTGCLCGELHSLTLPGYKIGMRIPNIDLINSHVQKTDIHKIVQGNLFTIVMFFQKDIPKNSAKKMIAVGHELSEKYALKFRAIFASDYDAEKIMADEEYSILVNQEFLRTHEEPFFIVCRPDHHLFCYGYFGDLAHLDEELSQFLVRKKA